AHMAKWGLTSAEFAVDDSPQVTSLPRTDDGQHSQSLTHKLKFPVVRRLSSVVQLAVPVLLLFEFLSYPKLPDGSHGFPTVPPGWDVPIYAQIAKEPGNFALLELPLRPFGDYMAYQTVHGKPIIRGYVAR